MLFSFTSSAERGRVVTLPSLFSFTKFIISFEASTSAVTIFCIVLPRATSIAVSYSFLVSIKSETTPFMPLNLSALSSTFFTTFPKPSYLSSIFFIVSSFVSSEWK